MLSNNHTLEIFEKESDLGWLWNVHWGNIEWFKSWCEKTYYSSFGFQLHFDKITFSKSGCWSCSGDWNIIILPVSQWLDMESIPLPLKLENPFEQNKCGARWTCDLANRIKHGVGLHGEFPVEGHYSTLNLCFLRYAI